MRRPLLVYAATLAMLAATWLQLRFSLRTPPVPLAAPLETIPNEWQGSTAIPLNVPAEDIAELEPSSYLSRLYHKDNDPAPPLQLFIAHFEVQQAGKSMHSPKNCLPLAGFETVESRHILIPAPWGPQPVNLYRVRSDSQSLLMLYWYQSPGRVTADEISAKAFLLFDRWVNHRSPGSIVRVGIVDRPGALEAATRFATWVMPEMRRCIGS